MSRIMRWTVWADGVIYLVGAQSIQVEAMDPPGLEYHRNETIKYLRLTNWHAKFLAYRTGKCPVLMLLARRGASGAWRSRHVIQEAVPVNQWPDGPDAPWVQPFVAA